MNKTANRLYAVVAIVLVAFGVNYMVEAATEPPEVERPAWTLNDLPLQLGNWRGEEAGELDPRVALATGAQVIVNRVYRDDAGHTVLLHTATFDDARDGVYHSPLNCYRAAGWRETGDTQESVDVADGKSLTVSATTWDRDGDNILVAYWFQLGNRVLFSRADLGWSVRWAMRGQPKWPVLFKLMLQSPYSESNDSKAATMAFAQQLAKWLNQPEHQKYLDQWPEI